MKIILKKINTLKLAFFSTILYMFISTIAVIIMLISNSIAGQPFAGLLILMPILYGIGGFISGLIMGTLYNLISRWIGGLEFDFEKIEKFNE